MSEEEVKRLHPCWCDHPDMFGKLPTSQKECLRARQRKLTQGKDEA